MSKSTLLSLFFIFAAASASAQRVFTKASGELFTGELVSADSSTAVIKPGEGADARKLPLNQFSPVEAAYLAAWRKEKAPAAIVDQQTAVLGKAIAARKPDRTAIGTGKPVLALIETWRLPNALPQPAYWRAKPIFISADGLVIIGTYSKRTEGTGSGLFRWESGKGVMEIQPTELPKEIISEPGTGGRPDFYLLDSFSKYLKVSRNGPNRSSISNTWGSSVDGKSYLGGTGDDWPMAQINGLVVDLEYVARTKLQLRTSLPWYVNCSAGAKADSRTQISYGVSMMSKASAISADGKTIAGFGHMGAWILHSPFGFGKNSVEVTLQSTGDDWRSKNQKAASLLEQAAKQPGIEKLGLAGTENIEELLSAYFPDRIPLFGPDPNGKTRLIEALQQISAKSKALSEIEISFTAEEKALVACRIMLRLRSVQDQPEHLQTAAKMRDMLRILADGNWPCPPPLENKDQLREWVRLSISSRNFHLEFPDWGVTGKGGLPDVLFRLKLMSGLQKAKAAVGDAVWKEWTNKS